MTDDNTITVNPSGTLTFGAKLYRCALGKSGVAINKKEGDGTTPAGTFTIRNILYRSDRLIKPETSLNIEHLNPNDAWNDDPSHIDYNKKVSLPHDGHAEPLWRKDELYNIIVVIGFNDKKIIPSQGSAIFLHVAKPDYKYTRGCIALDQLDLLEIITNPVPPSYIKILPTGVC
jgi:L,D-peptidoglycan transpeptidase YkuD (ErfK/YbiS/YcfS/YnhG family)